MGLRKVFGIGALLLLTAVPLKAQGLWEPEIGIRMGWSQSKVNGAADAVNSIDFPGLTSISTVLGSAPGNIGRAPLFAVIPLVSRIALTPELGFNELSLGGTAVTLWQAGLVANYAITPKVYAGVGGSFFFVRIAGTEQAQGGLLANVGYRLHLSKTLRLRIEGFYNGRPSANVLSESYAFGLTLGVSTILK
ncbi:MAG: hypothetical protein WBC97_11470 [Gemmatimonadales bacterium]